MKEPGITWENYNLYQANKASGPARDHVKAANKKQEMTAAILYLSCQVGRHRDWPAASRYQSCPRCRLCSSCFLISRPLPWCTKIHNGSTATVLKASMMLMCVAVYSRGVGRMHL